MEKSYKIEESGEEYRLVETKHKGSWWEDRTVLKLTKEEIKGLIRGIRSFTDDKWRKDKYW